MVGDNFVEDALDTNQVGIYAVRFSPRSDKNRNSKLHDTVHSMAELRLFFTSFDQKSATKEKQKNLTNQQLTF